MVAFTLDGGGERTTITGEAPLSERQQFVMKGGALPPLQLVLAM